MPKTIIHRAETRGHQDHGWLKARHTFSFANYYDPSRVHFGVLRVLNDDIVAAGEGFGMHPHENMEIITIPLKGQLDHKDNMGNASSILNGDIQVMSAGTGVYHSEYNGGKEEVNLLQIWVFPNKKNVQPRYQQITLNLADRQNKLQQIVSPNPQDPGTWIYQDAWFNIGKFDKGKSIDYEVKKAGNGVYVFVISGEISIYEAKLKPRDGIGIWETDSFKITIDSDAEILLMDIPMFN